jgi:hypothetical protein
LATDFLAALVDFWGSNADAAPAVALGKAARAALDTLVDNPLAFDDGVQVVFQRTGNDLMKLRHSGKDGVPFVWVQSLNYISKVMRTRA